jgi:hypothetical protein
MEAAWPDPGACRWPNPPGRRPSDRVGSAKHAIGAIFCCVLLWSGASGTLEFPENIGFCQVAGFAAVARWFALVCTGAPIDRDWSGGAREKCVKTSGFIRLWRQDAWRGGPGDRD